MRLPFLIELHNTDTSQRLPWELWRARVALDVGWRLDEALMVLLGFEHESDHASDGSAFDGFINVNSIAARAEGHWDLTACDALDVSAILRLHVLTCTDDPERCAVDGGLGGSRAFEVALGATWTHLIEAPWSGFVAAYGS